MLFIVRLPHCSRGETPTCGCACKLACAAVGLSESSWQRGSPSSAQAPALLRSVLLHASQGFIVTTVLRPSRSFAIAAGVIALMGACAYIVRRKSAQAEALNPPRGRFIDVDGVRLHYIEHGDPSAPALVLLHGNGTMATEMELSGLVERAVARYRVFVFDRPGYGYSERPPGRIYTPQVQAELLLRALARLGVQRPIVLGHSWGSLVATAMAAHRPQAVRGIVLVSGYYTPSARLDVTWSSVPAIPFLGVLMRHTVSPLMSRLLWTALLRRLFGPEATPQAFKDRYPVWMSLRPSQLRASAAESAMMIPQAALLLRHQRDLRLPVGIVAGEKDRWVMTGWQSRRLHNRLPGSRLHVVPNAGHMVHHSAPQAVLRAVDEIAAI